MLTIVTDVLWVYYARERGCPKVDVKARWVDEELEARVVATG